MQQKKKTIREPKVVTTIHLPLNLHQQLVDFKDRFGIPYNRTIQRGIHLAIREFVPERKDALAKS